MDRKSTISTLSKAGANALPKKLVVPSQLPPASAIPGYYAPETPKEISPFYYKFATGTSETATKRTNNNNN